MKESEISREDENALARERMIAFGCVSCLTILHNVSLPLGICFLTWLEADHLDRLLQAAHNFIQKERSKGKKQGRLALSSEVSQKGPPSSPVFSTTSGLPPSTIARLHSCMQVFTEVSGNR